MEINNRNATLKLPVELQYLIIDHLAADETSLSSCSLVCRVWTPVARSHLFRTLEIQSTASDGRIFAFKEFLQTCPDACAYIEDLTLTGCDRYGSFDRKRPEAVSLSTIRSIVTMLAKLQHFTLTGVSLQSNPLNGPDLPLASIQHLHSLRISGCHFHDEDMSLAFDAVRMFAALDELSFGGYWSPEHARASSIIQPSTVKIRHVQTDTLGATQMMMLSDFLKASGVIGGSLESLHFTWWTWAELKQYQQLIADAAPRMKRIELEPIEQFWELGVPRDNSLWQTLGLTQCARLESLCLHMNYSYLSYQTDGHKSFFAAVGAYTQVLAHYPPPSLRHLTLQIPIYVKEGGVDVTPKGIIWDLLDAAISGLSTLKTVTLEVRSLMALGGAAEHTLSQGFQGALARVHERGILCIRFKGILPIDPFDGPPVLLPPSP